MPRSFNSLGFLLVLMLGLYGCAKPPTAVSTTESAPTTAKVQKLEADYRAAVVARDQAQQKLAAAEDRHAKAQGQFQQQLEQTRAAAAAEKETLKTEVKTRTSERDALNAQYETFRKNLKDLLGSADTSVGALNRPAPEPTEDQGARN